MWIDEALHTQAAAILFARRRSITIVDAASFAVMNARGIKTAFAFDDDFAREGFTVLSAGRRT